MNNNLNLITVIVPSYNHDKYIVQCLSEIVKIDLPKKILIIDDGSTDNTPIIIDDFISKNLDEDIEFIQKENSGLVSSLNLGLKKAETEFLYLIASDDIPNPSGIKQAIEYLIEHSNANFFIGGGENFFEDGRKTKIYTKKHLEFFSLPFEKRYKSLFLDYPSPLLLQSTIFRTEILRKINGWDTNLVWDDYPMFVNLLSNEKTHFIFWPHVETVYYRHHGVNTYKNIVKQYKMVYQAMDILAPEYLKNKAIGNTLGYYGLKALSQLDQKTFLKLLSLSPLSTLPFALIKIFKIVFNKFWKKI